MIKNEHVKYEIKTNETIDEIEYRAGRIQQTKRAAPLKWRLAGREAPAGEVRAVARQLRSSERAVNSREQLVSIRHYCD